MSGTGHGSSPARAGACWSSAAAPAASQCRCHESRARSRASTCLQEMLGRAITRARRRPPRARPGLLRGDIRHLPFADASIACVFGAYGVVQSLTTDRGSRRDVCRSRARAEARRPLRPRSGARSARVAALPARDALPRHAARPAAHTRSNRSGRIAAAASRCSTKSSSSAAGRSAARHTFTLTFRTLPMEQLLSRLSSAALWSRACRAATGAEPGGRTRRVAGDSEKMTSGVVFG